MSEASTQGVADAETFLEENPRSQWAHVARDSVSADESLINAIGVARAASVLGIGCAYDADGVITEAAIDAFAEYSAAFRERVAFELAKEGDS